MYTQFFGFKCKPFQLTPDPEFLFLSRAHKRALTYLNYGIAENIGFILLTGQIGTGKTTLIRTMISNLPQDIRISRITNTRVTSSQLISMINDDFGIDTKSEDKTRMLNSLTDYLIEQYAAGRRSMLIIDEAQNLSPALLEEVRLLSNLETDKSKLLQIILVGQPELNRTLSRQGLEQLRQRISVSVHISPLTREETGTYIRHRLKVAGNESAVVFDEASTDAVYEYSKGIPRLINTLCDFTLLTAFADSRQEIDADLVREVMSELIDESPVKKAAAAGRDTESQQDDLEMKKVLASINVRLQNLEAIVKDMQKRPEAPNKNRRLLTLVNAWKPHETDPENEE